MANLGRNKKVSVNTVMILRKDRKLWAKHQGDREEDVPIPTVPLDLRGLWFVSLFHSEKLVRSETTRNLREWSMTLYFAFEERQARKLSMRANENDTDIQESNVGTCDISLWLIFQIKHGMITISLCTYLCTTENKRSSLGEIKLQ